MPKPYVIITAGAGFDSWGPEDVDTKGLTGAEEVTVLLSEALAHLGYRVAVVQGFTGGRPDRIVKGVRWTGPGYLLEHFKNDPTGDDTVLIISKFPNDVLQIPVQMRARLRLFWAHSIGFDDVKPETWKLFDRVICATNWQTEQVGYRYTGALTPCSTIPYGINPPPALPKVAGKCIYASSPDRGLLRLLRWWPAVRAACPGLTLYVAYGRDRMRDRAKVDPAFAADLADIDALLAANRDSVTDLGFVSKPEMDRHLGESEFWLYPTTFEETGCLIGRKAVAAGAKPVYSSAGCLEEVIEGWLPFWTDPATIDSDAARDKFVKFCRKRLTLATPLPVTPWAAVAAEWDKLLDPQPSPA